MDNRPLIIGHRGASHDAPENTLAAFRLAFEQGADGIEGDYRLTRDGQIVCMHDESTARTAGIDLVIAESTLEELVSLDVGSWKEQRFAGVRIPTLEEVLAILPVGKWVFIEIKCGSEIISPLKGILCRSKASMEKIRLLTFDPLLAGELRATIPSIPVCLNVEYTQKKLDETWAPSLDQILDMMACSGAAGLSSEAHGRVDNSLVDAARRNVKELFVWTVDSASEAMRYQRLGVDAVMTNRPGFLRSGMSCTPP
jgi:glycerophosphoryl diester phosphodiesterase